MNKRTNSRGHKKVIPLRGFQTDLPGGFTLTLHEMQGGGFDVNLYHERFTEGALGLMTLDEMLAVNFAERALILAAQKAGAGS